MAQFIHYICPVCGAHKTESSWKLPFKILPFGRVVESLGRGTLKTLRLCVNPGSLNLDYVKRRLLLTFKNWHSLGIISNEDIDRHLTDVIADFNRWSRNVISKSSSFRGCTKKDSPTLYIPDPDAFHTPQNERRITKPWK